MIDSGLDIAYRATSYQLTLGGQQWTVRIGEPATELADPLQQLGVQSWAFMTAWNPCSKMLSTPENERLNAQLLPSLEGHKYAGATAIPDDDSWPNEPGFVILDMPISELLSLAERFQQNAIVTGQGGGVPELIWVAGGVG